MWARYAVGRTSQCTCRQVTGSVAAPLRRSGNDARIKDPLADLHSATVNQRIERTTAPPSTLDSASAAHPRDVGRLIR